MGVGKLCSDNFVHFVDVVIKSPRIAVMIKRFEIGPNFDKSRHHQPFVQLWSRSITLESFCTIHILPLLPFHFGRINSLGFTESSGLYRAPVPIYYMNYYLLLPLPISLFLGAQHISGPSRHSQLYLDPALQDGSIT